MGGLILDKTVSDPNFAGMAVFTPVINGETFSISCCRNEKGVGFCVTQGSSRPETLAQREQDLIKIEMA